MSAPYAYSSDYFKAVESCNSIPELISAMADYSGYIRQAAIARAVKLAHWTFLPCLAARLNDWVPQVRHAARSALITLLPTLPSDAVLAILPTIASLRNAGRHDHSAWLETFEHELLKHIKRNVIAEKVLGNDIKVARACFDILLRRSAPDTANAIQTGLKSKDIVTGLRAAHAIAELAQDERDLACEVALLSRFGAIRAIGLRAYLDGTASPVKHATATERLLDLQSSVRAIAMAWLVAKRFDVRAYYHQILASSTSSSPQLRVSLAALCTFRQRDDAGPVRNFIAHPIIAVRAAAYAAWFKLAEDDKDQIAVKALGDEGERVKKLAIEMVARHGAYIPFATACALLNSPRNWPRLMRLGGNGKWDTLEAIARIAPSADAQMRMMLQSELINSMVQPLIFARPTTAQAAFLRSEEAHAALAALAGRDVRNHVERELALALAKTR